MFRPKVGFIVYGVHKDGLQDPMGTPFIDSSIIQNAKKALSSAEVDLVEEELVIATKAEAKAVLSRFKKMDDLDAIVLFSGTWVWAAHLAAALRDFAFSGKGILLWTHPGSQGWRPVGGLVLHGGLNEIGVPHRFVYGPADDALTLEQITSYSRAAHEKRILSESTAGVFGGRGMGQTCGVADPSQWMRVFGVDIDSRDTTLLLETARAVSQSELQAVRTRFQPLFSEPFPSGEVADRSLRLFVAIQKILEKEKWDFYTIQSFPGLGDQYGATCLAQSLMLETRVGTSTLSDFNTLLTVKLLTDFSPEPVYYGDLQHIDRQRGEIKIIGDGACPPSLAGKVGPARFAEHGIPTEGEAGGLSVDLVCKPGDGVLARLVRKQGEFELVIARCRVFEPSQREIEQRRLECGIPRWPHAFVTVDCDMEKFIQSWNNEYACLGYGAGLYADLKAFCEICGIRSVEL